MLLSPSEYFIAAYPCFQMLSEDIEMQKKIATCMEQFQWTEQQCKDIYDHKAREERTAQSDGDNSYFKTSSSD
jgi:hypothetical protein